jgi:hypothetical protein
LIRSSGCLATILTMIGAAKWSFGSSMEIN